MFSCPICHLPLLREGQSFICSGGHCYDIAREGYIHLLPVQKKHAADPGDTREMVAARRHFLSQGYYDLFREKACELVRECTRPGDVLLDAGCGEGYYTRAMGENREHYGFDISRSAVRMAAKSDPDGFYAVAGSYSIPFPDEGCDLLSAIFSPIAEKEFLRVLRPGGILLLAVPSPEHLYGLKLLLYDEPYRNETQDTTYPGFRFLRRVPVRGHLTLDTPEDIAALFAMTPYYWKSSRESSARAAAATHLDTDIGFDFLLYQKEHPGE